MYTQKLRVDDLQSERGEFDGPKVYARTKRAEVILTELWAEQLAGTGVVVHAMHPGWADTPGVRSSLPRFYKVTRPLLRTPAQGADTIVWLGAAAEPGRSSGRFWHDRRPRPTHRLPMDTGDAAGARAAPRRVRTAQRLARRVRSDRVDFNSRRRILMAHYRASIDIQQPREDVFAYLSDFSTTREWDPGVVEAERLNGQRGGRGNRVPAGRRVPRPQERAHLSDRRVRPAACGHLPRRERHRGLAGQDHVRVDRRAARASPTTPTSR